MIRVGSGTQQITVSWPLAIHPSFMMHWRVQVVHSGRTLVLFDHPTRTHLVHQTSTDPISFVLYQISFVHCAISFVQCPIRSSSRVWRKGARERNERKREKERRRRGGRRRAGSRRKRRDGAGDWGQGE